MSSRFFAIFPGQGAQHVGMGKDLFEQFKIARETFEEAADAAHLDIRKLCFDGPDSDLTLTENTQPCLLTTSIAAFRVAQSEIGFAPAAVAGHSLGEYSALVSVGALSLSSAVRWVRERGIAMQKAVPSRQGSMAAVLGGGNGGGDEWIGKLCEKASNSARSKRASGALESEEYSDLSVEAIVEPANFNAPGQIVIAGSVDAVAEAISMIKTDPEFSGAKAILLNVSAPFHCRLMAPARDRMAELFSLASEAERPSRLLAPYVPNRTARLTAEPGVVFELLIDQVDHPVLWKQSMITLLEQGWVQGIEFGPGKVLQGLAKRISQGIEKPCTVQTLGDTASLKLAQDFLKKSEVQAKEKAEREPS